MQSSENLSGAKTTCALCEDKKKLIQYPDGSVHLYLPALAMDSFHRGVRVIKCPGCN